MKNILLVCSAGMSTSLMVKKMQEAAEKKNADVKIWAVANSDAADHINQADVILLGPQIRFMKNKISQTSGGKPVEVINMQYYGTMNGEKVLDMALELLGE